MTISSLFIRRPRLAFVVSTVITIAGLLAMTALPVAQFPDIVPPQVRVTATYPGASAQAVEESVAQVIEGQVNGVEKMIYMKSTSGGDGSYALTVSFEVGSDPDLNTVNVTNRVNQVLALLPPEVQRLGVTTKKQSSALLQVIAVYSPKGSRDALFLSNFATITLLDTLHRVPGVGDATLFGPLDYSMRVWLNLDRMSSLDITADDVVKAVQAQNVQAAVGLVGAAPLLDDVGFQLNITTQGRLTTVGEFENIVVRAAPDGALVRIKDIARVELGAKSSDSVGRYNGKPAAGIQIYQLPGANALATAQGVRKAIEELEPRFPDDVAYDVMYDTTVFVEATIESVIHTLIEAFVLVAIVVFIFLGNLRATLIPIIAVPVALVGTFAVMLALGFSANTISLLALVLAIGIVVDDAIVVVEAVEHILEHEPDLTPAEATEKAMSQVTAPIIAITLVLLSVFIPTAFIPGITGQLYQQFAVAVSVSMVISAINALSLSPALCSLILRHRKKPRGVMAWLQNGIDKSRDGYVHLVTPIARRTFLALILVGGFVLATGGVGSLVPSGFLPDEDQGAFMAEVQLPDAASTNRTAAAVAEVEKTVQGKPWMQSIFTVTGYSLLDGLNMSNRALVVVELKPFAERKDPTLTVFYALQELNKAFAQIASANVFAFNLPPIMGLGNSSGFEFVVQSLAGAPPADLAAVARGMMISAQQVPQLAGVFTTYAAAAPQINLKLDRERAQALGVSISDIFSAMQTTLGGTYTNDFNLFGRTWQVKVQADAPDRSNVNDIFRVRVRSSNGELLPLQAVANVELVTAPSSIVRYNNLRSVVLNGAAGARLLVRPGDRRHGDARQVDAARRLRLRMDRHGAAGEGGERPDRLHPGARRAVRLPLPRRPLREHGDPDRGAPVGRGRPVRRGAGALHHRSRQQHLRPDRHRRADRARRQERHPDHRVRDGGTRQRQGHRDGGDHGRRPALPRRHDDLVRLHPGPGAAGHRLGRRRRHPARRRHRGVRRHDRGLVPRHLRDPGPLRRLPDLPREGEGDGQEAGDCRVQAGGAGSVNRRRDAAARARPGLLHR